MRRLAVCALFAVASAGFAVVNPLQLSRPRPAQAGPAKAVRGEEAVRRLKAGGGYDSLAAAMAAARYQINARSAESGQSAQSGHLGGSGASYYANNPAQRLRVTFAPDEVHVDAASDKLNGAPGAKPGAKPNGEGLRMRLAGFGYGDRLEPLADGVLTAHDDRVTIRKSAIRNPQSAIEEWYVNKPEGVEQGFTVSAPPASRKEWGPESREDGGPLRVVLTLGAGWRASARADRRGAFIERRADGMRLGYDQLEAHDARGRLLDARMSVETADGVDALSLLVDDARAVYPLTIDPVLTRLLTQEGELTGADGAADDQFGSAVAISGDTVVVGAVKDDVGENGDQGSAYVFTRSLTAGGSTQPIWTLQQKLTAADGAAGDFFGRSVAISGDTVVVGAFDGDIDTNVDQGAAYVFTRTGAVWTQRQKLTADDGAAQDLFGLSVAVGGDTVVVGAPSDAIGANQFQGSAYVFTRSFTPGGGTWTQRQKLTANDGAANDLFGLSVAVSGDTVVVGAPFDLSGAKSNQGSAYVFTRSSAPGGAAQPMWTQQQKLNASDSSPGDRFGISVAISGDTVVVGDDDNDVGANVNQGAAYVFTRGGTVWAQRQKLTADDGAPGDQFGFSVALSGDTVVVGAHFDDVGANVNQGSAYVFSRGFTAGGVTWAQRQKLTANDGAPLDDFGFSVALSGDTVVAGAQLKDVGENSNQGAAYVFVISANERVQQQPLTAFDGALGDQFGESVSVSGDTVVVGAFADDIGETTTQGSAYVFTRSFTPGGVVWSLQQKLTADDGAAGDQFGFSVALSGDTLVVGAPFADIGASRDQGSVYVFTRSLAAGGAAQPVWTKRQKLTANDGAAGDLFGASVAIGGDTVAVGAVGVNVGDHGDQGSAYVFTRGDGAQAGWAQQQKLTADDGATGNRFGRSVAISGDTVVAGAPNGAVGANAQQGSAYVFTRGLTAGGGVQPVWTKQQKLTAADGAAGDLFGFSVALSGDTVVVSAHFDDVGANQDQGSAYVFTRGFTAGGAAQAVWAQQQKLTAADGEAIDLFGFSVALSGETIVVGAVGDNVGGHADQGSAYVFTRGSTPGGADQPVWAQRQRLSAGDGAAGDQFGFSVALSGDTVVVGAPSDAVGANGSQGSAYVFAFPACPTIELGPGSLPDARVGSPYTQMFTASGGEAPYTFTLGAGALPTGLSLAANGALSGAPSAAGAFTFTAQATDANGCQGARTYTLTVTAGSCVFAVSRTNFAFPPGGGGGQVEVTAAGGCAWTAASGDPMITITSGAAGNGSGVVKFDVSTNPEPGSRRGTLTVAGQKVVVAQAPPVTCVSAASFAGGGLAAESIVSAFGGALARATDVAAAQPLPETLAGAQVGVLDSQGTERFAALFFVSPGQINFQIPPGVATGTALVFILRDGETIAAGEARIDSVSPGLFSADASGLGVLTGLAVRAKADKSQSFEPVARFDEATKRFVAIPIDLGADQGAASDQVFLVVFATGLRNRSGLKAVNVKIGGVSVDALYAGPQGAFTGLDQINVLLPRGLAGKGEVELSVTVDGKPANALKMAIR